jgi:predicted RNA-binding Zn ribbon-like protein
MPNRTDETIPAPPADLCLTFANTRYWRGTAAPTDELQSADEVLRWAAKAGHLPAAMVKGFGRPAALLEEAIELREIIHRCFAKVAAGRTPTEDDLGALNAALMEAPLRQRVRVNGWDVGFPEPWITTLLAPVLWSAADLLVGPQLSRVRQCANPACGWLFLDTSKGGNRRWCSMSACGNRAKAHRHYLRQKNTD